jgi:hypothetical protein
MILYALVVYPILGALSTHAYPSAPTFGLPCPTTIFTFGILLWTDPTPPRHLLVIPVLWAIVGTTASFTLGIAEDIGLGIAALVTVLVLALGESHRGETIARV